MILAVDPGTFESAWVVYNGRVPLAFGKEENAVVRGRLAIVGGFMDMPIDRVIIEMIGHYGKGMPAGKEVFDTCLQIGRLQQIADDRGIPNELMLRGTVKMHMCGSMKAKDGNIRAALIDKLGPQGTKRAPGPTHGISGDIWQALAVAVTASETT